jgi:hypothetical protein
MKRGPVIHGALLVVALVVAYQTWTRDKSAKPVRANVTLWGGAPADVESITLTGENKKTVVERRKDGAGAYLWGVVERTTKPLKPKDAVSSEDAPPTPVTTVREFPVGEEGDKLVEKLAPLQAVRDLGALQDAQKKDFGLEQPKDKLVVKVAGKARELVLGGRVYGGDDRYVLEPTSNHVFVIPADVLRPLESADGSLRERKVHAFEKDEVAQVVLKTPSAEKALVRGGEGAKATWASAATPGQPDQTLANFMNRMGDVTPTDFAPTLDEKTLELLLTVEYKDKGGKGMGRLQLFKKPAAATPVATSAITPAPGVTATVAPEPEYYVRTERTRVLAKLHKAAAERVDKDLTQIFAN